MVRARWIANLRFERDGIVAPRKTPIKEITEEIGERLYQLYVVEKHSVRDSVSKLEYRTGIYVCEREAGKYIREQGWTRSQRYYAKRSKFNAQNNALFEETRAKNGWDR
jgi:hypothetical protein